MLPKENRLDLARQFRHLKKNSRSLVTLYFTLLFRFVGPGAPKVGFIVSNKIGTATKRSRVRRLLREVVHSRLSSLPAGVELVLIAKTSTEEPEFAKFLSEFNKVLPKIRP